MALVITLKKGGEFMVGDHVYKVEEVSSGHRFVLRRGGDRWVITDQMSTEIEPDVHVCSGKSLYSTHARVSIDAPKSIKLRKADSALASAALNSREANARVA